MNMRIRRNDFGMDRHRRCGGHGEAGVLSILNRHGSMLGKLHLGVR